MNSHRIESTGRVATRGRSAKAPRRLPLSLALAAALGAGPLTPSGAGAATYTWAGNKSNATWGTPGNWTTPCTTGATCYNSDGGPPQDSILIFDNSLRPTIYGAPSGRTFESISFGLNAGATSFEMDLGGVVINLSKGILNLSGKKQIFKFRIDALGDQTWAGGSGGLQVYNTGDLNHALTLSDVTMGNVGNVNTKVGTTGTGILNIGIKSSLAAPEVLLGEQYGSSGTVNLTDASARLNAVGNLIVGFGGTGNLNLLSGQASSNQAYIGMGYGSDGTVLIDGATSKLAVGASLEVGRASTGTVTVQNGGTLTSGQTFIGTALGGDGLLRVLGTGSSWATAGQLTVGELGVGSLRVEAGGTVTSQTATLGNQGGSLGQAVVSGKNASWVSTGKLQIGNLGEGILSIEQGGWLSTGSATLGNLQDAGNSTATVTGVGSRWDSAGDLRVDRGTLTISNGGVLNAEKANFGETAGSTAWVDLSGTGAVLNVAGILAIGSSAGTGTVTLGKGATLNANGQLLIWKGGVLNLEGGTLNAGWTVNDGQVNWNSGTVNFLGSATTGSALLGHSTGLGVGMNINATNMLQILAGDDLSLNGGQAAALGLELTGDMAIGSFSQLSIGADGGRIDGSLQLAGGSISSVGRLDNAGLVSGYGVVAGSGGFVNNGLLQQGAGSLVLSNTGTNRNTGTWEMLAGRSLSLGTGLDNEGALLLNGGTVNGAGLLANRAQGTISGSGRISSAFVNQGSLVVDAGQLRIDQGFANSGQILLGSNAATLAGGQIANRGLIQGLGRINNNIANTDTAGVIEAQGGTLTLAGQIVGANGGTLVAGSGAKLLISQGLASNAGQIQLAGGTFDNNGRSLVNEVGGRITGFGSLRAGTISNQGQIFLSGGTSALRADIVAGSGSQIILSGLSNTTFYGTLELQNGAELRVTEGSAATFAAEVKQRNGADVNGDGQMFFEGGLSIGNSPGYGHIQGSVSFASTNSYLAEIGGIQACSASSCALGSPLVDVSFDKLVVGGNFKFGGKLVLTSWNGFVAQAGQSFDLLDWGTSSGTFKSIDTSGFKLAADTQLDLSALYTTGTISVTAVPEPAHWALMLAGLSGLAWKSRRHRLSRAST